MNLATVLTLCRFLLVPVYLCVFFSGYVIPSFFILLLAGATDVLDGHLARSRNQVTELGMMLDPLADKTMMIAVIVSLLSSGYIPWEAALALFVRDAGMIIGAAWFHFRGLKTVPANFLGKLTTVLYYAAILLIVFEFRFALAMLWGVVGVSLMATLIYIRQIHRVNRTQRSKEAKKSRFTGGNL